MNKYLAANLSKEQQYTFEGAILKVYRPPCGSLHKCLKLALLLMTVAMVIMSVTVISMTVATSVIPMSIIRPAVVSPTNNDRHWRYINRRYIYPGGRNVCPNHRMWHIPTSSMITSPMLCTGGRTNTC